ncbi:MAG: DUF2752 domain-containing protein [Lachnospiraceae bacterium]|nr:DUF2752 domain-containing protein [Lachnospiraceae bacterium]
MQSNKPKQEKKQPAFLQAAFIFVPLALIFIPAWYFKLYRCPLESILGIPCPLCGISRAFKALLSGDIRASFYYHPLWPLILLSIILYLLYAFQIIRPGRHIFNSACILLSAALLVCFILRHISGSPIVRIHFEDSLLCRLFSLLSSLLQ